MCAGDSRGQKRVVRSPRAGVTVVSCPVWALGTKLGSLKELLASALSLQALRGL